MPTIAELKASHDASGKKPEELRLWHDAWRTSSWFTPYYNDGLHWFGLDEGGTHSALCVNTLNWQLWQEPKPRKVVYEWVVISDVGIFTSGWWTEQDAREEFDECKSYHKILPGRDAETGEIVDE